MNKETFLLTLILFLPVVNFEIYLIIIFIFSLVFIIINNKKLKKHIIGQISILITLIFIYLLIKFLFFESIDDYKEILKLIVFGIVFYSLKDIKFENIEKVFLAYVFFDFMITLFQFYKIDFVLFDFISALYNSSAHAISLDYNSVRALGLSPGPGQHGALGLFIFTFFITLIVFEKYKFCRIIGLLSSLLVIIFSQSKSAVIGLIFILISISFFSYFSKNKEAKYFVSSSLGLTAIFFIVFLDNILLYFRQYQKLIELGLGTSSFQARIDKWTEMINPVFNEPLLFLLGPGRSYLDYIGIKNSVFDSDYIYVFINYGFIVLFITLFLIITFLTKFLINFKLISLESKILFFIVLVGCITGISINFFFHMKILLILPFIIYLSQKVKDEYEA